MAPPCRVFEASALPHEIQMDYQGRRRKTEGGAPIDLSACELLAMTQYECQIDRPEVGNSPVRCWPVQRWFRRCRDKKGSFMVETTKWEGTRNSSLPNAQTQTSEPAAGASETRPNRDGGGDWVNDWRARD
ncbi:hypothetical protein DL768_009313 [Monosporascus sp. mg162]|nr:hypothetical protein DL768_009313 [Monosporascus sp. mg162]